MLEDSYMNRTLSRNMHLRAHWSQSMVYKREPSLESDEDEDGGDFPRQRRPPCSLVAVVRFVFGMAEAVPTRGDPGFCAIHPTSPFYAGENDSE